MDHREATLLHLDTSAGCELHRTREVGFVADQQHLAEVTGELDRVEVAAAKALAQLRLDAEPFTCQFGRVHGSQLWTSQTRCDPRIQLLQRRTRGMRLTFALCGQWPRGIVLGRVLGVTVSQQPDHRA